MAYSQPASGWHLTFKKKLVTDEIAMIGINHQQKMIL
jgi:hypothetical protein